MPETRSHPEAMMGAAPIHLGAAFATGRNVEYAYSWRTGEQLIPVLEIENKEDRDRWGLENIRVFSDGTLPSPELNWKPVIDSWLTDLKTAVVNRLGRKEAKEAELDIKAMMAVSASARAMEQTAGGADKYVALITADREGDLDRQDTWAEFLLHNDPDKLNRVISHPLVKRYYNRLLEDAGIAEVQEWHKAQPSSWKTEKGKADERKLVRYLRSKNGDYKGGFNEYIADVLLAEDSEEFRAQQLENGLGDTCRWAAARLACDAFLVDKFTRWEFEIDKAGEYRMKPSPTWGGDPLRSILEPSFLPRRIKKMYRDTPEVLDMMDASFRMDDAATQDEIFKKEQLQPSMVIGLKNLARYNIALFAFLGGSRATGVPLWTKDTIGKDLPIIAEMLDQIYGSIEDEDGFPIGKHVVGAMIAKIVFTKALSAVHETAPPDIRDRMAYILETEGGEPFKEAMVFLWGPKLDSTEGWLKSLTAARTRMVFRPNKFPEVVETLRKARFLLEFNDQTAEGVEVGQKWKVIRGIFKFAKGISAMPVRY